MPRRRVLLLLVRRIRVVTKPAATALLVTEPAAAALRLRPLLVSAEIEKLCRGGFHAQHQSHGDSQRNQPTTLGKGAFLLWSLWHAPGPHTRRTCLPQTNTIALWWVSVSREVFNTDQASNIGELSNEFRQ
jgi:hypothetical protein